MAPGGRSLLCPIVNCLLLLLSLSVWSGETAENIDLSEPIVRTSPALASAGDYFGYSATLHQLRVPSSFDEALANTRIIVGAPRGTFPGGLTNLVSNQATPENATGLVYDCPVTQGMCGRLGDGTGQSERLFDSSPNTVVYRDFINNMTEVNEVKSNQRMGSTVVSSGDLFVACAPLYSVLAPNTGDQGKILDSRSPVGRCFVSSRDLTDFVELRPCVPENINSPNGPNRCITGTSAVIGTSPGEPSSVVLGSPGDADFIGTAQLYSVANSSATRVSGEYQRITQVTINSYESYAMTTGNVTGSAKLDYLMSAPRTNGSDYKGTVVIRQADNFFSVFEPDNEIRGTSIAEYFGHSVAAADLNGDGYDEIIVGAPMYSTDQDPELGRVFVFKNTGGSVNTSDPIILSGDALPRSRFGTSMIRLGDVNDDGFEDFAVSAPFQEGSGSNTGKVFIYYGSENFTDDVPDQVITADNVVDSVSGLNELKTFGWSLTSGVDVDNNQYLDLLVGAYESATAVLFRAKSVANIFLNASTDLTNNRLPIDLTATTPTFNLQVCASFSGRGLTGSLDTMLNVKEILVSGSRRLQFDGGDSYNKEFVLIRSGELFCRDIPVTTRNKESLYSSGETVENFQIQFTLTQEERVIPPDYDGNPSLLTDLTRTPILVFSGSQQIVLQPEVTCSGNSVCRPDLSISRNDYVYLHGRTQTGYTDVVAGSTGVDTIRTVLTIQNSNSDAAIGAGLTISMPTQFMFSQGSSNSGTQLTCTRISEGTEHTCTMPNYIGGNSEVTLNLTWTVRIDAVITGEEMDFTSSIVLGVPQDTNINNNMITVPVGFSALTNLSVAAPRLQGAATYDNTQPPTPLVSYDQLGSRVTLVVTVQNRGPSDLQGDSNAAIVNIRLPTRDADSGSYYYLYPATYSTEGDTNSEVSCDMGDFNVDGLQAPADPTNSRRKRTTLSRRQTEPAAQDSNGDSIPDGSVIKNCNSSLSACEGSINCTIKNWGTNLPIMFTIISFLDRRFLNDKTSPYTFLAHATISVSSSSGSTKDGDLSNNEATSNAYSIESSTTDNFDTRNIIIAVVVVIGAILLIIALFCVLYFVGFFRRKKYGEEAEGDFEVRELPPEGTENGKTTVAPNGEGVEGDPSGVPGVTKESLSDKDRISPADGDIGDASDLHDGEIAAAEGEPDETSL